MIITKRKWDICLPRKQQAPYWNETLCHQRLSQQDLRPISRKQPSSMFTLRQTRQMRMRRNISIPSYRQLSTVSQNVVTGDLNAKVGLGCIWTLCFHKWNTLNNDVFKTSIVVFHKVLQWTNARKLFTHIQWFFTLIFGLLIAFLFSHKTHTGGFIDSCTHYSPLPSKIFLSTKWKHKSIYLFQMV